MYRTYNNITGEYYIGVHTRKRLNDDYLGSGLRLIRSIGKYGRENFTKHVILKHACKEIVYAAEKAILKEHLQNPLCLNLAPGGTGGATRTGYTNSAEMRAKQSASMTGLKRSEAACHNISEARKKIPSNFTGRNHTTEAKKKMSDAKLGKQTGRSWNKGQQTPEAVRVKISTSLKGREFSAEHKANLSAACLGKKKRNRQAK